MDEVGIEGVWALADALTSAQGVRQTRASATVVGTDAEGVTWVRIAGADTDTPASGTVAALSAGDAVEVEVSGGRLTVVGNATSPAVGQTVVEQVMEPVEDKADEALDEAGRAAQAAEEAVRDAERANAAAEDAEKSAKDAHDAADAALNQLAVVEDVAGTLEWISKYGGFKPTEDAAPVEGKVYFALVDGEYTPVVNPTAEHMADYWELGQSQTDYVMAHLAVTSSGLWVLPSGIGESETPQGASGYKMLLANDGAYLYDADGHIVTTFGESIRLDSSRPQYIGGDDAYIMFYDSDNDGKPDSIRIGGSKVTIDGSNIIKGTVTIGALDADAQDSVLNSKVQGQIDSIATDLYGEVDPVTEEVLVPSVFSMIDAAQENAESYADEVGDRAVDAAVASVQDDLMGDGTPENPGYTLRSDFDAATQNLEARTDSMSENVDGIRNDLYGYEDEDDGTAVPPVFATTEDIDERDAAISGAIEQAAQAAVEEVDGRYAETKEGLEQLRSYVRISADEEAPTLELGQIGNNVTAKLTNSSLEFGLSDEDAPVASIGSDAEGGVLKVTRASISTLAIGDDADGMAGHWEWQQRANGNLTAKWVPAA